MGTGPEKRETGITEGHLKGCPPNPPGSGWARTPPSPFGPTVHCPQPEPGGQWGGHCRQSPAVEEGLKRHQVSSRRGPEKHRWTQRYLQGINAIEVVISQTFRYIFRHISTNASDYLDILESAKAELFKPQKPDKPKRARK